MYTEAYVVLIVDALLGGVMGYAFATFIESVRARRRRALALRLKPITHEVKKC